VAFRISPLLLLVPLAGAVAFALYKGSSPDAPEPTPTSTPTMTPSEPSPHADLPPSHPPIPSDTPDLPSAPPASEAAIEWKVPDGWQTAPNPSSMRIATYKAPKVGKDAEDAEMSVTRVGGGIEPNIQRWIGQFEGASKDKRTSKTVHGLKVTIVEVGGTYSGGMMMPGAAAAAGPKTGWALLAAIVDVGDTPYFFKMTGPSATVQAARPKFDALVESITPKK
jgi:hypothetical protein